MASLDPKTGILGKRLAAHLLRRTTYNVTKARINEFAAMSVQDALDRLLIWMWWRGWKEVITLYMKPTCQEFA